MQAATDGGATQHAQQLQGRGRVPGGVDHDDLRVHVESELEGRPMAGGLEGLELLLSECLLVHLEAARTGRHEQDPVGLGGRAVDGILRAGTHLLERVMLQGRGRGDHRHGCGLAQPRLDQGEREVPQRIPEGAHAGGGRPAAPVLPHLARELQQLARVSAQRGGLREELVEPDPATDHRLARIVGEHASHGESQAQDPGRALDRGSLEDLAVQPAGSAEDGLDAGLGQSPVPQQASADLHVIDLELARLEREQADAARGPRVVPHARVALGVDAGEGQLPHLGQQAQGEVGDGVESGLLREALGGNGHGQRAAPVEVSLERASARHARLEEGEPQRDVADDLGAQPHGGLVNVGHGLGRHCPVGEAEHPPGERGIAAQQLDELGLLEVLVAGELEDLQAESGGARQVARQAQLVEALRPHGQALLRTGSRPATTTRFRPPSLAA